MPIYEYLCERCEGTFEVLLRAGENAAKCPRCGGDHLTRQLSRFAAARGAGTEAEATSANGPAAGCCGGACGCC